MTPPSDQPPVHHPIDPPAALLAALPRGPSATRTVHDGRAEARAILEGRDDRLLVVVGPCSIHDPASARDYAARLARLRRDLADHLAIVMRVYFEKPRTTVGWKGLINDPDLDGSFAVGRGLRLARELLLDVTGLGVPAAVEFLDPLTPGYLADLVSWGAIGARTTESQVHRELASGLPCPVGFKNGTDGSLRVATDAILAASRPHRMLAPGPDGRVGVLATGGNPAAHLVLRGGLAPNHDAAGVASACSALAAAGLALRAVVDVSHANSGKRPENQPRIASEVATQVARGERRIVGVMIESHLVAGRQDVVAGTPMRYGQSITDGCLGWDDTVAVLEGLAAAVDARRRGWSSAAAAA